jgi:hypothetical protein
MPFRINLALDLGAKKQIGEGVKDRHDPFFAFIHSAALAWEQSTPRAAPVDSPPQARCRPRPPAMPGPSIGHTTQAGFGVAGE